MSIDIGGKLSRIKEVSLNKANAISRRAMWLSGTVIVILTLVTLTIFTNYQEEQANRERLENQLQVELERSEELEKEKARLEIESHEKSDALHENKLEIEEREQRIEQLERELQAKIERERKIALASAAEAAKPEPAPVANHPVGCQHYRDLVSQYSWDVSTALLVMEKESGCNPTASSPTNDHGLMQVNFGYHSDKVGGDVNRLYDPATNVRIGYQIYAERGNWSGYYAVCSPSRQPLYAGVHCG